MRGGGEGSGSSPPAPVRGGYACQSTSFFQQTLECCAPGPWGGLGTLPCFQQVCALTGTGSPQQASYINQRSHVCYGNMGLWGRRATVGAV